MVGLLHHPVVSRRCASHENEQAAASLRKAAAQLFVDQAFILVACKRRPVLFAMSTKCRCCFAERWKLMMSQLAGTQCHCTLLKTATLLQNRLERGLAGVVQGHLAGLFFNECRRDAKCAVWGQHHGLLLVAPGGELALVRQPLFLGVLGCPPFGRLGRRPPFS